VLAKACSPPKLNRTRCSYQCRLRGKSGRAGRVPASVRPTPVPQDLRSLEVQVGTGASARFPRYRRHSPLADPKIEIDCRAVATTTLTEKGADFYDDRRSQASVRARSRGYRYWAAAKEHRRARQTRRRIRGCWPAREPSQPIASSRGQCTSRSDAAITRMRSFRASAPQPLPRCRASSPSTPRKNWMIWSSRCGRRLGGPVAARHRNVF
jgi:hypothetical protein